MRIGLLNCGNVQSDLIHIAGEYADMFKKLFDGFKTRIELIIYDITRNQYPSSLDEVEAYISTGSKYSVYDNREWIKQFSEFVINLYRHKKKFVGICFGHQMIAHALGGRTSKSERGWGVGLKKVRIIKNMTWMEPTLKEYELYVTH